MYKGAGKDKGIGRRGTRGTRWRAGAWVGCRFRSVRLETDRRMHQFRVHVEMPGSDGRDEGGGDEGGGGRDEAGMRGAGEWY